MLHAPRGMTRARHTFASLTVAALTAASVLALGPPVAAEPVRGTYQGPERVTESEVMLQKGEAVTEADTRLMRLAVDKANAAERGDALLAYCIEMAREAQKVSYTESGWNETALGSNAKYVNWILYNSYPHLTLDELAERAGLGTTPSRADAVAGTQAAIWRYSDGYRLAERGNREPVQAVYRYLTGDANTGLADEPAPTLALSPERLAGGPGELLGPVRVSTSAEKARVSLAGAPDGARLLGSDRRTPVTTAKHGDELWVSIPESASDGALTVDARVATPVSPGRVFRSSESESQTLVLASSDTVTAQARSTVAWQKKPAPVPSSTAEEVCEPDAGVKLTLTNNGQRTARFTVAYGERKHVVAVGPAEAVTTVLPFGKDAAYEITITSGTYRKVHKGTLDCSATPTPSPSASASPSASSVPSPSSSASPQATLPTTGGSGLLQLLGTGAVLLAGGVLILSVVRRQRTGCES